MRYFVLALPFILLISQCQHQEPTYSSQFPGKPGVPSSIKNEHKYLLDQVHAFTLLKDSTAYLAAKLDSLMQHHFQEEEDFVLPPLGHLPLLASGIIPEHSEEVIQLTEKLKSQLTHMSVEHQLIKAYLSELKQSAVRYHHPEIIEFEKQVHQHASAEEEVFFPAAILAGEYLRRKSLPSQ